ncbi:MAG: chemotaxis protein CheW [Thermodesulfovibrionales bacterium]
MERSMSLVTYSIEGIKYAIPLHLVKKVIRVVEITPLPQTSDKIMGIINYYGEVVPIINMRRILNLPTKEIDLSDQIIIVRATSRTVGLLIDQICDIQNIDFDEIIKPSRILKDNEYTEGSVQGCIRLNNGLIVIHSIDTFISNADCETLDRLVENTKQD